MYGGDKGEFEERRAGAICSALRNCHSRSAFHGGILSILNRIKQEKSLIITSGTSL